MLTANFCDKIQKCLLAINGQDLKTLSHFMQRTIRKWFLLHLHNYFRNLSNFSFRENKSCHHFGVEYFTCGPTHVQYAVPPPDPHLSPFLSPEISIWPNNRALQAWRGCSPLYLSFRLSASISLTFSFLSLSLSLSLLTLSLSISLILPLYPALSSLSLPIYLLVCIYIYQSICLSICLSLSIYIYIFIYLSIDLSFYLSVFFSPSPQPSLRLSISLGISIPLSVCLFYGILS